MAAIPGNRSAREKRGENEERYSVRFPVSLMWEEKTGTAKDATVKRANGECVDLSPEGMKVELKHAVTIGITVQVVSESFGRMGHAVVRHAQRDKMQYVIGLRFGAAFRLADSARQRILQSVLSPDDPHAKPNDTAG